MSEPFVGQIMTVPYTFAPYTWAFCQGQQMQVQQLQALYTLLGASFGGTAGTNFNLPDLRGRFVIGAGTPVGIDGLGALQLAQTGGLAQQTLNANQVPLPGHVHTATFTGTGGGGGGGGGAATASGNVSLTVSGNFSSSVSVQGNLEATANTAQQWYPLPNWTLGDTSGSAIYADPAGGTNVALAEITSTGTVSGPVSGTASGSVSLPVTGGSSGGGITGGTVTVGPTGAAASTVVSNMPPYLVLNNIIALNGIFPTRD